MLHGLYHVIGHSVRLQENQSGGTEIKLPTPLMDGVDNNAVAKATLSHLYEILIGQGRCLLCVTGLSDRCISLSLRILSIAKQASGQRACSRTDQRTFRSMVRLMPNDRTSCAP